MEAAEEVEEEIEAVLAIIMEGIDILRKSDCIVIKAQISPLTALDSEQCFVGYQLELSLDKNYPLDAPAVQVLFSKRFLVIFLAKARPYGAIERNNAKMPYFRSEIREECQMNKSMSLIILWN